VISAVMVHTFHASRRLGRQQQGKDGIAAAITWQDTVHAAVAARSQQMRNPSHAEQACTGIASSTWC